MKIRKSAEDYLERILMLSEGSESVRSIDIANSLGVSKPSVSIAMKNLLDNGYILMDENKQTKLITLTEKGLTVAHRIYDRHKAISAFLIRIGVPEDIAREDACRIEHDISEETYAAICEANRPAEK